MNDQEFIREYFEKYHQILKNCQVSDLMIQMRDQIVATSSQGGRVVFAGNGASASIASHAALDFTKQAKIKSTCFNEPALLTAFANDYGYEHWLEMAISLLTEHKDIVVLISSSGKSRNIINAAELCKRRGTKVITFSGFEKDNPLSSIGDLNFWVDCKAYNIVESIHQIWLLGICDLIIGKMEYSVT